MVCLICTKPFMIGIDVFKLYLDHHCGMYSSHISHNYYFSYHINCMWVTDGDLIAHESWILAREYLDCIWVTIIELLNMINYFMQCADKYLGLWIIYFSDKYWIIDRKYLCQYTVSSDVKW